MVQKLTYTQYGDYYIPDIRLHIWEYTLLTNMAECAEHSQSRTSNDMVLTETLFPHMWEVQQTCEMRMELLMDEMLTKSPAPDKATQQFAWVAHMKLQAEELAVSELIYN